MKDSANTLTNVIALGKTREGKHIVAHMRGIIGDGKLRFYAQRIWDDGRASGIFFNEIKDDRGADGYSPILFPDNFDSYGSSLSSAVRKPIFFSNGKHAEAAFNIFNARKESAYRSMQFATDALYVVDDASWRISGIMDNVHATPVIFMVSDRKYSEECVDTEKGKIEIFGHYGFMLSHDLKGETADEVADYICNKYNGFSALAVGCCPHAGYKWNLALKNI